LIILPMVAASALIRLAWFTQVAFLAYLLKS
jgi:hypothetical protein